MCSWCEIIVESRDLFCILLSFADLFLKNKMKFSELWIIKTKETLKKDFIEFYLLHKIII